MQPLTGGPRGGLTEDQVRGVLQADDVDISAGAEVVHPSGDVVDVSEDVQSLTVESGSFRTVHRTCQVRLGRPLDWPAVRLAPHVTVSDGDTDVKVELGRYLLETPQQEAGRSPPQFEVDGYGLLQALNYPLLADVEVSADTPYLSAARETVHGVLPGAQVSFAEEASAPSTATPRLWTTDRTNKTVTVVNDLLAAVNYRGLWADWRGVFRSGPYQPPSQRPAEWTYDTADANTTVLAARLSKDTFHVPNWWTFRLDDPSTDQAVLYVRENRSDGPTSFEGRGNRWVPDVRPLDVADRATLEAVGDRIVDETKRLQRQVEVSVQPNPLHWHFDVVNFVDDDLGVSGRWQVTDWSLDVDDSARMRLTLRSMS